MAGPVVGSGFKMGGGMVKDEVEEEKVEEKEEGPKTRQV
jgi:hypothetical protein